MSNNVASDTGVINPFREEIAQLRALLAEGGLDGGVLEGRYLNQLKRVRQLGVKLETEKTHSRQLAAQLAALETKQQQQQQQQQASETAGDESEDQRNSTAALRERLERAYVQLHESKLQVDEHKKEAQRMRKILQHEIGGTPQELEGLLKNAADGAAGGWRGRAQQIVVLRGKVKELERALAAAHAEGDDASRQAGRASVATGATSVTTSRNRDVDDVARERVAELQQRRLLQQRELQEALDKRTAEMEAQKRRLEAAQARNVNLEADNQALREHLQTVMEKTENDNVLIDTYKEELEELRRALRTARMKVREWEAWNDGESRSEDTKTQRGHEKDNSSSRCVSAADALNAETAIALVEANTAIEINRLRMQNEELRDKLARVMTARDNEQSNGNNGATTQSSSQPRSTDEDTAPVVQWLRSVVPSFETAGSGSCVWQTRVAEVLRQAHGVVCFLERQRHEDGGRLSKCYETIQRLQAEQKRQHVKKGKKEKEGNNCDNNSNKDDHEESETLVNVILQENHSLKQRVKMLQELLEKERMAYESIHFASSAPSSHGATPVMTTDVSAAGDMDEENGDKTVVTVEAFQKLRRQYEELRSAFNSAQKERLRHCEK